MRNKEYQHFVPKNDSELAGWGINVDDKIDIHGPVLGLLPADITDIKDKANIVIDTMNRAILKKREQQEAIALKKVVRNGELKLLVRALLALKLKPMYTENMGRDLGIVGITTILNRSTIRTSLKLSVFAGVVEVAFRKNSQPGVSMYSKLLGDDGWTLLGTTTVSPYRDERPLRIPGVPETRQYMAMYWDGHNSIGIESDVVSTLYGG